jgi:hypothetical protein
LYITTIIIIGIKYIYEQLRRLVASLPLGRPEFNPKADNVGSVVESVALGQVFSQYFGFPCHFSFHRLLLEQFIIPSWML